MTRLVRILLVPKARRKTYLARLSSPVYPLPSHRLLLSYSFTTQTLTVALTSA